MVWLLRVFRVVQYTSNWWSGLASLYSLQQVSFHCYSLSQTPYIQYLTVTHNLSNGGIKRSCIRIYLPSTFQHQQHHYLA